MHWADTQKNYDVPSFFLVTGVSAFAQFGKVCYIYSLDHSSSLPFLINN